MGTEEAGGRRGMTDEGGEEEEGVDGAD